VGKATLVAQATKRAALVGAALALLAVLALPELAVLVAQGRRHLLPDRPFITLAAGVVAAAMLQVRAA
jgi:hypothetical protein